jgi:hypothetical protein
MIWNSYLISFFKQCFSSVSVFYALKQCFCCMFNEKCVLTYKYRYFSQLLNNFYFFCTYLYTSRDRFTLFILQHTMKCDIYVGVEWNKHRHAVDFKVKWEMKKYCGRKSSSWGAERKHEKNRLCNTKMLLDTNDSFVLLFSYMSNELFFYVSNSFLYLTFFKQKKEK